MKKEPESSRRAASRNLPLDSRRLVPRGERPVSNSEKEKQNASPRDAGPREPVAPRGAPAQLAGALSVASLHAQGVGGCAPAPQLGALRRRGFRFRNFDCDDDGDDGRRSGRSDGGDAQGRRPRRVQALQCQRDRPHRLRRRKAPGLDQRHRGQRGPPGAAAPVGARPRLPQPELQGRGERDAREGHPERGERVRPGREADGGAGSLWGGQGKRGLG